MQAYIGLYLHGFLSSGNSEKGQWLKQVVNQKNLNEGNPVLKELLTPTYPIKSPHASVDKIESLLKEKLKDQTKKVVLLGSSMGGYYAQYLGQKYQLPYIMINPALNPTPIFNESLGCHTNQATQEDFCIDQGYIKELQGFDVKQLNKEIPALLLIDTDDEVIDVDYALKRYETRANGSHFSTVKYSGGDHRFIHMQQAWLKINKFLNAL
ncbi:MAG: YqiA/YcfP family alpha/beta fold hydrolase [Pseudomonadota bacterium]|nr:YqiA/YcfP family alpha/beta fold hydrolase [Pseudomonadota bacterium]